MKRSRYKIVLRNSLWLEDTSALYLYIYSNNNYRTCVLNLLTEEAMVDSGSIIRKFYDEKGKSIHLATGSIILSEFLEDILLLKKGKQEVYPYMFRFNQVLNTTLKRKLLYLELIEHIQTNKDINKILNEERKRFEKIQKAKEYIRYGKTQDKV